MTTELAQELDRPYPLTEEQISFFREQGFIKLKHVLSPEVLDYYGQKITSKVIELNTENIPLEERDTYGKAFLQIMNIWAKDETVKEFAFSKKLARIAAELMGTEGVRMYHDQALYKESGGGHTPWHVDQAYWPLDSEKTVTVWIPLQRVPLEMGPLCFAARSHDHQEHRNLLISDESEKLIQKAMDDRMYSYVEEPFDLGEVSFHYGWTYHRADPNTTDTPRRVMTVIYMDRDIRIADSEAKPRDWEDFCGETPEGKICAGPLNPILWEK